MTAFTGTLTWVSHGTFLVETGSGMRILVDGFVENSPTTPDSLKGAGLGDLDHIFVTHGHVDHVADVAAHQQRTGATVYAIVELAGWFGNNGIASEKLVGFNKGGSIDLGDVCVTMVDAKHSSSTPDGAYAGDPAGFVFEFADGYTIYFSGDTTVFSDMAIIGELYEPDLAVLSIGDFYTMGPREAAKAVELVGARHVIGGHWGTFPGLTGTPTKLAELLGSTAKVHELAPGESYPPRP
ncbi:MAG: beta-lactamase domain protein [Thermoleophilia bacterium]|nr:beta-lactamase domain protein [Thermoleophilia bacterium]